MMSVNFLPKNHLNNDTNKLTASISVLEPNIPISKANDICSQETDDLAKIDINVNNVVCSYSTRCHLNLRRIAMEGMHVEYKKESSMVNMKLRSPLTTATMWSSGKITCAGAKSEIEAYKASRRFCRVLQRLGFRVKLCNFRIVNVLATCTMPFEIDINKLANSYPKECSYEPELHPGATYKIKELKTTFKVFTTGSITVTAPSVENIHKAIRKVYPILKDHEKQILKIETKDVNLNQTQQLQRNNLQITNNHHNNHTHDNNINTKQYAHQSINYYQSTSIPSSYQNFYQNNHQLINNFTTNITTQNQFNINLTQTPTTPSSSNTNTIAFSRQCFILDEIDDFLP